MGRLDPARRDRGHPFYPGDADLGRRSSRASGRSARDLERPSSSLPWRGSRRRSRSTRAASIARRPAAAAWTSRRGAAARGEAARRRAGHAGGVWCPPRRPSRRARRPSGGWTTKLRRAPRRPRRDQRRATAVRPRTGRYQPWRQKTDPAGLFAFSTVPSGDWLVVACSAVHGVRRGEAPAAPSRGSRRDQRLPPAGDRPCEGSRVLGHPVHVIEGKRLALGSRLTAPGGWWGRSARPGGTSA